jgi:signal transduction histidine kinase/CheY-like chemotaxis protein
LEKKEMLLKKLLGQIIIDMGFVKRRELEEALRRQRKMFEDRMIPERLQRNTLVAEARMAKDTVPMLGQILVDMGSITSAELEDAIQKQSITVEGYESLESDKLGIALEMGSVINSTLNLAEVLTHIMDLVNQLTNSVASTLMLLDDKTGELVFSVPTGPKADTLTDIRISSSDGIAGWVVEHEQPALIPDAKGDPRFYQEIDKISGIDTKSILCVPLMAKTKLIGVLEVINKSDGTSFTDEDALLLGIFASQAAMAIENARLYSELKDSMEDELRIQKKLAELEKFRALGQLASGVAHDFNNVLMSIQGNTSLTLLDINSSSPHYERLKNIEQTVLSGAGLTKQLLGFAKGGKYEVKSTNLNDLIKQGSGMFGRTNKEIKIYTKLQPDIHIVEVDQTQIESVFVNLYLNAWEAMPGGGKLRLQTENVILDEISGKLYDAKPGKYVKISVTDTGVGMDEEIQKRIFDPFFTTKEKGRGTGLGLASAYSIIKNHEGTIDVYSKINEGTTFHIYLPASEKKFIKAERELPAEILQGEETLLFVDDEEMIIDVGRPMLEKMGYKVFIAQNGKEAIEIYNKKRDEIDMVVLDMIMPDMGGSEAYDRLKQINPSIKVLLSSGYSVDGLASEILKRGCDGFIQKPFHMKELSQKLREILDKGQ